MTFAPQGRRDLASIGAFIAPGAPVAAARLLERLREATLTLGVHPERGRPGLVAGTRELVSVRPYIVVYRVLADRVQIARIFHAAQDR